MTHDDARDDPLVSDLHRHRSDPRPLDLPASCTTRGWSPSSSYKGISKFIAYEVALDAVEDALRARLRTSSHDLAVAARTSACSTSTATRSWPTSLSTSSATRSSSAADRRRSRGTKPRRFAFHRARSPATETFRRKEDLGSRPSRRDPGRGSIGSLSLHWKSRSSRALPVGPRMAASGFAARLPPAPSGPAVGKPTSVRSCATKPSGRPTTLS